MRSVHKSPVEARLLEFCEGVISSHGFRIVDLDCAVSARSLLRIFIDVADSKPMKEDAKGSSVSIDDCVRVTGVLGPALEVEDLLPGAYDLEVSSPGLERRLRLQSDFESFVGSEIKLRLNAPIPEVGRNLRGTLMGVGDSAVELKTQGRDVQVPWSQIRRGNLIWADE